MFYANIDNSIMSKYDAVSALTALEDFDIIALTEMKPKVGLIPDHQVMELPDYDLFTSNFSAEATRGTGIYVKKDLLAKQVYPAVSCSFQDCTWVTLKGQDGTSMLAGVIYRSGSPIKAIPLDLDLHSMLAWAASTSYSHKVVVGDFNHPEIFWTPDPEVPEGINRESPARKFIECIHDAYFLQHITEPTRYREGQRPTLDDLLFTNEREMVEHLTIRDPVGASDHVSLSFVMSFAPRVSVKKSAVLKFYKADYEGMKKALDVNWPDLFEGKSVQEMADMVEQAIADVIDRYVPKVDQDKNVKRAKPLWMNRNTLRTVKKKHHAWIRFLNTKDGGDYQNYVKARNEATHATRKARREFESRLAKEVKGNHKVFWNYVNHRRKSKCGIPDLRNATGDFVSNDKDKANLLNHQYASVFTDEDLSSIPTPTTRPLESDMKVTVTVQRVHAKLKALKIDKSPGPDNIHPRVLQELADQLAAPITLLFSSSMATGEIPLHWKVANVTPIFKKGDRNDPANYRPVSLTSILCKLLERIVCEDIIAHLKTNNLIADQQHGFITGKSTVTNLLEALDVWTEALSHNLPVDIVFLDYAKAFDTVPHERLLAQIKALGIDNETLRWIRSFLTGRRQRVKVNGSLSDWVDVTSGVPQGSVLGPLLFSMFVCDIPEKLNCFISMFADDTKVYEVINKLDGELSDLQLDINSLQDWARVMQMRFHPLKCKVMHLGSTNPGREYTMMTTDGNEHTLQAVNEEKDLGITIDKKLSFSKHVTNQVNKANKILGAIKHTFANIDSTVFMALYKSIVRPHLEYATVVWSPKFKKDTDALEQVQRRATRLVNGLSHLSYSDRLRSLNLPTLEFRRKRADIIETSKF